MSIKPAFALPEGAAAVERRRNSCQHLLVASAALYQDRMVVEAAGGGWDPALLRAHEAIQAAVQDRGGRISYRDGRPPKRKKRGGAPLPEESPLKGGYDE